LAAPLGVEWVLKWEGGSARRWEVVLGQTSGRRWEAVLARA